MSSKGSRASASKWVICLSLSVRAHAFAFVGVKVSHWCSECTEINSVNYGMSTHMWVVAPKICQFFFVLFFLCKYFRFSILGVNASPVGYDMIKKYLLKIEVSVEN